MHVRVRARVRGTHLLVLAARRLELLVELDDRLLRLLALGLVGELELALLAELLARGVRRLGTVRNARASVQFNSL